MAYFSYLLPDTERIVVEALREYLPRDEQGRPLQQVFVQAPFDWFDQLPYVVVRRDGGVAPDLRVLDSAYVSVDSFHHERAAASLLARQCRKALLDATRAHFTVPGEGALVHMRESSGPQLVYDGLTAKHGDASMFSASYTLAFRPDGPTY